MQSNQGGGLAQPRGRVGTPQAPVIVQVKEAIPHRHNSGLGEANDIYVIQPSSAALIAHRAQRIHCGS